MTSPSPLRRFLHKLGPGLLFAAAAIGVSHLVQSTRAGAGWGLAMAAFIVFANALKYPAFRFGPHYAAATQTSLLQGYRNQGTWALVLYLLLTLGTMFAVQAAVTMVTAGLLAAWLGIEASPVVLSAVILAGCFGLLVIGRYHWLDRVTKVLVATLTIATIIATGAALGHIDWATEQWILPADAYDGATLVFLAALIGWMPSAIDVAVWNSLWTLAKSSDDEEPAEMQSTMTDFHVGYVGTAFLALCFMLLGTGVMHGKGIAFEKSAGAFAGQVLELYSTTLGPWSGPIIGLSAVVVMFSTTLAVLDGFPRALGVLATRFVADETRDDYELTSPLARNAYRGSMVALALGALVIVFWLQSSLKAMVDVATTLSFLTAPLLALLNHRAVFAPEVGDDARPGPVLRWWSIVGIVVMSAFAIGWLWFRFVGR
jgi:Mn2+/Fe2+ NRAMP family transporter